MAHLRCILPLRHPLFAVTWEAFAQKKDFRKRIHEIEVEIQEQKLEMEQQKQRQGKGRPWWQLWGKHEGGRSSSAAAAKEVHAAAEGLVA